MDKEIDCIKPISNNILSAHDMIIELLNANVSKTHLANKMGVTWLSISKILNKERKYLSYQKFQKLLYFYCSQIDKFERVTKGVKP